MFFMELAKNNICKSCMLFNLKHLKWHISFLIHWMVLQLTFDKYENEISPKRCVVVIDILHVNVIVTVIQILLHQLFSFIMTRFPMICWFFSKKCLFCLLNIFLNYWMHILLILNIHYQKKWFMMWFSAIYLMHQWDNQRN